MFYSYLNLCRKFRLSALAIAVASFLKKIRLFILYLAIDNCLSGLFVFTMMFKKDITESATVVVTPKYF